MVMRYGDGTDSSVGTQLNTFAWRRKSLEDNAKKIIFGKLSKKEYVPKNMGTKIKVYHHLPILSDRNINDQGLDAAGAFYEGGNLFGSSKDIGLIKRRIPTIREEGGRQNRVGWTRIELEGEIQELGMFLEYTEKTYVHDTEPQLIGMLHKALMEAAIQVHEKLLQADLLNSAGVVIYGGDALLNSEMTAEGQFAEDDCVITIQDLMNLSVILDDNECPTDTTMLTGSTNEDTVTVATGRIAYIGSPLENQFRSMLDQFGNPAFIPVQKYASQTNVIDGEIGTIHNFRIVKNLEMLAWEGAGATATLNPRRYRTTGGKYDVFPMLVVGSESFAELGFSASKNGTNFLTKGFTPGTSTVGDPQGKIGLHAISWYYGLLVLRPEWIAVAKTLAKA